MDREWWRELGDWWLDVSSLFRTPEQTRTESDWIQQALSLKPGMKVLDVPSGDGRLSLELASGLMLEERTFDPIRSRVDSEWTLINVDKLGWENSEAPGFHPPLYLAGAVLACRKHRFHEYHCIRHQDPRAFQDGLGPPDTRDDEGLVPRGNPD